MKLVLSIALFMAAAFLFATPAGVSLVLHALRVWGL